jgi:hypothetical protein
MAKSYVPHMLFLVKRLNIYITKHQTTIFGFVTDSAQQDAITNCNTCLASLLALITRAPETP